MAKSNEIKLDDLIQSSEAESIIKGLSFEEALGLLEQLVQAVERGSLTLDASIKSYEKGMKLAEHLRGVLSAAETKLKLVKPDGLTVDS